MGMFPQPTMAARMQVDDRRRLEEENKYLVRCNEHLKKEKHKSEAKVSELENQCGRAEQRAHQYKSLYENLQASFGGTGSMEISNLHEQLTAVMALKDALYTESVELRKRLKEAEAKAGGESEQATCVACM